jgi:hypothetical protein
VRGSTQAPPFDEPGKPCSPLSFRASSVSARLFTPLQVLLQTASGLVVTPVVGQLVQGLAFGDRAFNGRGQRLSTCGVSVR